MSGIFDKREFEYRGVTVIQYGTDFYPRFSIPKLKNYYLCSMLDVDMIIDQNRKEIK
jgi:hypothetical protein